MILSFLCDLSAGQRIFYEQVCNVAHLVVVMPSTNVASECSFFVMRRIKSYVLKEHNDTGTIEPSYDTHYI